MKRIESAWLEYFSTYNHWPVDDNNRCLDQPAGEKTMSNASTGVVLKANVIDMLTVPADAAQSKMNPKGIVFLREVGADLLDTDRTYVDPWGNPYKVLFDVDYDGLVRPQSSAIDDVRKKVIVWSMGPDGKDSNDAEADDNITSWSVRP